MIKQDEEPTMDSQLKRWDKMMEEMDKGGYWEVDSPPYALNPILRERMRKNWERNKGKDSGNK